MVFYRSQYKLIGLIQANGKTMIDKSIDGAGYRYKNEYCLWLSYMLFDFYAVLYWSHYGFIEPRYYQNDLQRKDYEAHFNGAVTETLSASYVICFILSILF